MAGARRYTNWLFRNRGMQLFTAFPCFLLGRFLFVRSVAAAAAFSAALLGVRAPNTGFSPLFCPPEIEQDAAHNAKEKDKDDEIFHHDALLRAYSAVIFRFVLRISAATIEAITTTAANPARAAATFKEAGAVSRVPTV